MLPVAKSQDSPGPIARTVSDAATELQAIAGADAADPATAGAPAAELPGRPHADRARRARRIAVIIEHDGAVPGRASPRSPALGATTVVKTVGTPSPNPASIVTREFKRDLNAYLGGTSGGAGSLQGIIDYNTANPVEGLKYQQGELIAAQAVDLTDPATSATYDGRQGRGQGVERGADRRRCSADDST